MLDARALEDLRGSIGDDPEFLAQLIDAFLADAPEQLAAMHDAAAANDLAGIVRPAHTLKSSAATFGALLVANRCRDLETDARAGTIADPAAAVEAVGSSLELAIVALAALRAEIDAS